MFVMNVAFSINFVIKKKNKLLLCTMMYLLIVQIKLPVIYYAKDIILLHILYLNVFVLYAAMSSTVSKGKAFQCSHPIKAVLTVLCALEWYSN